MSKLTHFLDRIRGIDENTIARSTEEIHSLRIKLKARKAECERLEEALADTFLAATVAQSDLEAENERMEAETIRGSRRGAATFVYQGVQEAARNFRLREGWEALFEILDAVETDSNGKEFHPVYIASSRLEQSEKLREVFAYVKDALAVAKGI